MRQVSVSSEARTDDSFSIATSPKEMIEMCVEELRRDGASI